MGLSRGVPTSVLLDQAITDALIEELEGVPRLLALKGEEVFYDELPFSVLASCNFTIPFNLLPSLVLGAFLIKQVNYLLVEYLKHRDVEPISVGDFASHGILVAPHLPDKSGNEA